MKIQRFIFLISCLTHLVLFAQKADAPDPIKFQIEELSKKGNIKGINRILNTNTYLEPEFVLEVIQKNIERAASEKENENLTDTYLTLGNFWFTQGNLTKAFDSYLKSETLAREIKDYRMVGLAIMNRSNVPEDLNQKISMLKESVEMLEEAHDTLNLAKAHLNLGNNYSLFVLNKKDSFARVSSQSPPKYRKEAFKHYDIARELNSHLKNPEILASVHVHYGEWFRFEKNYEEARKSLRKAEEYFIQAGRIKGKVYCLLQLALTEKEDRNFESTFQILKEAEEIAKTFNYIDYQVEIYQQFFELFKITGDTEKTLNYYELYHNSALNLAEINSQDKIHRINLEHNLSENEYLLEKAQNQKNTYRILTVACLVIIAFVLGFSYLIIQNKKRKIQTIEQSRIISDIKIKNQELQEELLKEKIKFNQEHLIAFANQVNRIEEFLKELKSKLKNSASTSTQDLNSLKLSFSEIMEDQSYVKQINSLSSELNQDFFLHLRKNYQKISKNDEQLLSFLILEMSSKKIAGILKISTESAHTKRYRLRRKLNIPNEESFIDFYKRIIKELEFPIK